MKRSSARNEVERWFLRRGIPHFIDGYSVREDVLTRAAPFLALVFVGEVFVTFGDRHRGWVQAATFVATLALLLGAAIVVNRLRGRSALALPDDIGVPELSLFLLVPPVAALLFGSDPVAFAILLLVANVTVLVLAYLATSYGLVPMVAWGVRMIGRQLDQIAPIIVRTLPFLLLFSVFFLLSAEVWQVADDMPGAYLAVVTGGMVVLGSLFVVLATRANIDELNSFESWHEISALCEGTPVDSVDLSARDDPPSVMPLQRRARINVSLVMFVSQAVQIVIVSAAVFAFYLLFGLLTVRESTLARWIGDDAVTGSDRVLTFTMFDNEVVATRQLLIVAGFVATFAGLQFAVQVASDRNYRREFASDMATEVRQALAVRAAVAEMATAGLPTGPLPQPRPAAPR